ncbi:MAG TPA: DUF1707 domain-containing protein [Jatrophihabitans sp.]|nr:DUF1707 domain-containing protein [Jatrophihabitans sp.]
MAGWSFGPYPSSRELRVGTAERERAVQLLGEHLSAGRLDLAEFEERVTAAYAARTDGELRVPFRDLPGPAPTAAPPARRRVPRRTILLLLLLVVLGVSLAEAAFPPFLLIGALWLVVTFRRRRYAYAAGRGWSPGNRRGYPGPGSCGR